MNGCMGKILFVDLSDNKYWEEYPSEETYRSFIGGDGLGVRILYEKMKPKVDPLGPDNILGFLAGPFPDTKFAGGGRFSVVGKSPLTGGWGDSNCGGKFGPMLKRTGYDGIFIVGKASKPVYLYVTDETVEIRDASRYWGMTTSVPNVWLWMILAPEPCCSNRTGRREAIPYCRYIHRFRARSRQIGIRCCNGFENGQSIGGERK